MSAFLLLRSTDGDDLTVLAGLTPTAVLTLPSPLELRTTLLERPAADLAVVVVGWEALLRGLPVIARQGGAAAVLCLLPAGSESRVALLTGPERRAASEGFFFADRVIVAEGDGPLADLLRTHFPHAAAKIVTAPAPLPPALFAPAPDTGRLASVAARVHLPARPEYAVATAGSPLETAVGRASLPVRAWRVLRRRGLGHVVRTVLQRLGRKRS